MEVYRALLTPLMAIEILIAEVLFCAHREKEDYYWIRLISLSVVAFFIIVWIELFYSFFTGGFFAYGERSDEINTSIFKFFYYLLSFLLTVMVIRASYRGNWWSILYYCSAGFAAQHLSVGLASIFALLPFMQDALTVYPWLITIVEAVFIAIVYLLVYQLIIKKEKGRLENKKNVRRKVVLSLVIIFLCIGLSRITIDNPNRNFLNLLADSLYSIICCAFVLIDLYNISEKEKYQEEVDIMTQLLHREHEQYKLSKENIELINIKCHDLKHQINALKNNPSDKNIEEIEQAIMIYDSVVKTGNDVLDVILTEKSLFCEKNKIVLTCMVDGKKLGFINNSDLYSLFGNALSNAIEAVMDLKDTERRTISLNVSSNFNILSIHVENFFDKKVEFVNGLPITNNDKKYHGFGMKSMDMIAKKYQGALTANVVNDIFSLDIVMPIPDNKTDENLKNTTIN